MSKAKLTRPPWPRSLAMTNSANTSWRAATVSSMISVQMCNMQPHGVAWMRSLVNPRFAVGLQSLQFVDSANGAR